MPVSYDRLFILMKEKGIKKIDLRHKYGINPKTVNSLVNNRSVNVDTIIQLCEILDCQPGDLMQYVKDTGVDKTEKKEKYLRSPRDEVSLHTDRKNHDKNCKKNMEKPSGNS